jgi:hypothetical protein
VRRRHQRGNRKLPGPGSPTGRKHQRSFRPLQPAALTGYTTKAAGGMNPGPSTGSEVFEPGRQGIRVKRDLNPVCGSADLLGTPSAVFSFPFLPVVSRRMPRGMFTCRTSRQGSGRGGNPALRAPLLANELLHLPDKPAGVGSQSTSPKIRDDQKKKDGQHLDHLPRRGAG